MPAVSRTITDVPAPADIAWQERGRTVLRMLVGLLDRLVPPPDGGAQNELPPEWFKYPPF